MTTHQPTIKARLRGRLAGTLVSVRLCEQSGDYDGRAIEIYRAVGLALQLGYPAGIDWDHDSTDPDVIAGRRAIIVIELPGEGQVRWHMNQYAEPYDGSTTKEKYIRIERWIAGLS